MRTKALAGSDDANLLIRHVQRRGGKGTHLRVGAGSPGPHHSESFDVAEESIPIAIDVLEALLRGRAGQEASPAAFDDPTRSSEA